MIDPGAVMDIADPVFTDLITGAISSACVATAKRAKKGLSNRQGAETLTNAQLLEMLLAPAIGENISLSTLVALPHSKVTAHQLREALNSRVVAGVIQQLVCAQLVMAPEETFVQIRSAFTLGMVEALDRSQLNQSDFVDAATELFEVLRSATNESFDGITGNSGREPSAEIFAQLTLIRASIEGATSLVKSLTIRNETDDTASIGIWKTRYRQQCSKLHGFITPPDFKERNTVPLDKIYVPARISGADDEAFEDHQSLYDIIDDIDRDVLVGDPGGGKSTTTHAIAYRLATTETGLLPFVVVLREYAQHSDELSIVEYIERQLRTLYQSEAPAGLIETFLDAGEALVIFDGLDELLESNRRIAIAERIELFSSAYPLSKIYVTSRKVGYKEARLDPSVFRVLQLEGYSEEEVELYVSKWFSIQSNLGDMDTTEAQKSFIRESREIPDLRSNPLLLALLCIIYRGQGYLPKNRIGIYEECSKLLFETWDRSRGLVFNFTFENYIQDALKHLAFWMWHDKNADEGVSEPRLIQELTSFFSGRAYETEDAAKRAASEFVQFCSGRAWVLSEAGLTPDHIPLFKFTHRTFMEYFAATQVNRLNPEPKQLARFLLPKVARNEWDTVGQLCIHLIHRTADQGADVAISQMLRSSEQRSIAYRENVLGFISRCLADLTVNPKLVKKVIRASVENLCKAHSDDGAILPAARWESASWRRLAHLDTNADAVRDEFDTIVDELFASDMRNRVEVAILIVTEIADSANHPRLESRIRPQDWVDFTHRKITQHKAIMVQLRDVRLHVGVELLANDCVTPEEFLELVREDGELPLDFVFHPMAVIVDSGIVESVSLSAYLLSVGSNLPMFATMKGRAFTDRWLVLLRLLSSVIASSSFPLVNRSVIKEIEPVWERAYRSTRLSVRDANGIEKEWTSTCILFAIYLELGAIELNDRYLNRPRGKERLVSVMAVARSTGEPMPAEVLDTLDSSSPQLARVLNDWATGAVDFVDNGDASQS